VLRFSAVTFPPPDGGRFRQEAPHEIPAACANSYGPSRCVDFPPEIRSPPSGTAGPALFVQDKSVFSSSVFASPPHKASRRAYLSLYGCLKPFSFSPLLGKL